LSVIEPGDWRSPAQRRVNGMTEIRRSVAEGDVEALNRYIEKRKHVPVAPVPSELYIFNS
jgi:hypothetical protein